MSDSDETFEEEVQDQVTRDPVRAQLRKTEERLKASEAKAKEFEMAARELEFMKAGVDISAPGAKYFVKAYDGELKAESIRVAAEEANLIQSVQKNEQIPTSEKDAWKRVGDAAKAGEKVEPTISWEERIGNAKNEKEVNLLMAQYRIEQSKLP